MLELLFDKLDESSHSLPEQASRLFHGRGHCYQGLSFINIDWLMPVVWVVIYGEQEQLLISKIRQYLQTLGQTNEAIQCVMLQQRLRGSVVNETVYGTVSDSCHALENGLRYELNLANNQNIGFFMDARPARDWIQQQAEGKKVLNLFAYTCSFSVAALAGGAAEVVNIDMARSALITGQRNHELNALAGNKARFLPHDVFRSTRKLEKLGPYELVVIDPPSRQKGSFEADKDYGRLLARLATMLADNAQILACLNAPYLDEHFLPQQFAHNLPDYRLQQRLDQRPDFPEQDLQRCLKMQVFTA